MRIVGLVCLVGMAIPFLAAVRAGLQGRSEDAAISVALGLSLGFIGLWLYQMRRMGISQDVISASWPAVPCPYCHQIISGTVKACPVCGNDPLEEPDANSSSPSLAPNRDELRPPELDDLGSQEAVANREAEAEQEPFRRR